MLSVDMPDVGKVPSTVRNVSAAGAYCMRMGMMT
jgi:hypothetical protein